MDDNIFLKTFQEKQAKSKKRLGDYIKESGEEQIHDLRTSIRRLEAAYLVLPKSCKRKKTDYFVSSYKSLFKKNSPIRDSDIIHEKLVNGGLPKTSAAMQFLVNRKEKKLKSTLQDAKKLSKLKISKIKTTSPEKILQKYERTILVLTEKIQGLIPVVISDESKIDELHLMRKTAKKLRYVLELDSNSSYQHVIDSMKSFQQLLGEIHDCDVALDFLEKHSEKFPELKPLIPREQNIRSQIYKKLATSLSD
jgi:CHAD domain-containing protein